MSALWVVTMAAPSSAKWTAEVTAGTFMYWGPSGIKVAGQPWRVEPTVQLWVKHE